MNFTNSVKKIAFLFLGITLFWTPIPVLANTLFPHTKEVLLSTDERVNGSVSYQNDSRKEIYITPIVYIYNPQTLEMSLEKGYLFTRAEKEIFTVKPNETVELNYEIVPISNMKPGTYFNLLLLQQEGEQAFVTGTNPIGTTENLAHLLVLHISDSESNVKGITTEFADIEIEVVNKGIPFLSPTKIKYIYKNKTNYVLNPMGEIQLYSTKGKYPPEYIKINREQEKLYPKEILEEEFEVERYHISDFFSQRVLLGKFYNGIDENVVQKEVLIQPNLFIFMILIILILAIISLFKIILSKKEKRN